MRIERVAAGALRVTGALDRSNARLLADAIAIASGGVADGHAVEVDCSGVAFLDASGVETLALAARRVAPSHALVVVEPGAVIGRLLRRHGRTMPSLVVVPDEPALSRAS